MKIPNIFRREKKEPEPERSLRVENVNFDGDAVLIATSKGESLVIRGPNPQSFTIRENVLNMGDATVAKVSSFHLHGIEYPDDHNMYNDYFDSFRYVPLVGRALSIRNDYVWQAGYDLEGGDESEIEAAEDLLSRIVALDARGADLVFRDATPWADAVGNFYWKIEAQDSKDSDEDEEKPSLVLRPLDPRKIGIKRDKKTKKILQWVYREKPLATADRWKPGEVLHLNFSEEPWDPFGYGTVRRVIFTLKNILFMLKYLPKIARMKGDPWLSIGIKDPDTGQPLSDPEFKRAKKRLTGRKPGEHLIHDGQFEIDEVYKAAGSSRQTVGEILEYYRRDLVAGLGVPEVYLGSGSTTLKGTAEHQELGLESEVRSIQRYLKRFMENQVFPLLDIKLKLTWRPLKEEDFNELSNRLMGEIEHAVSTPEYARQRLGYPELGEGDEDMPGKLLIHQGLFPYDPENPPEKPMPFSPDGEPPDDDESATDQDQPEAVTS